MRGYRTYQGQVGMWYGMLPSHWHIEKAKRLFHDISEKNYPNEPLLSATQESGVVPRDTLDNRVVMPMGEVMQYKLVQPGDFVISLRSFEGGVEYSDHRGLVSPAYTVLRSSPAVYKPYFKYLLKCHPFVSELNKTITGIREGKNINYQDFREIDLPYPPRAEQDAIVAYLDGALAEIDRFIAAKTRLIALLRERKAAIINRAVTRGLDAGAPTKPSGIAWLVDVPAQWEVKRLKAVIQGGLVNGLFMTKEWYGSGDLLVNVADIYQGNFHVDLMNLQRVQIGDSERITYQVQPGDIFFVRSSLKLEGVGQSATVTEISEPTVFECHLVRARPDVSQILAEFLILYLNCHVVRQGIISLAKTVTMSTIDQEQIASIQVALPPRDEQRRIVQYIESASRSTDAFIAAAEREIELMREYRTALISDAVTGKIDVRGTVTEPAAKEAAVREEARI